MDTNDVEVIEISIDPNILESYEKSKTEYDLCESFKSVCELSSCSEDTSSIFNDKCCNSKDFSEIKSMACTHTSWSSEDLGNFESKPSSCVISAGIINPFIMNQNLIDLFLDLKISEENDSDTTQLIERGPDPPGKRVHKQCSIYYRDTGSKLKEKLRFLSGSTVHEISSNFPAADLLVDTFSDSESTNFYACDQPEKVQRQCINSPRILNSDILVPNINYTIKANLDSFQNSLSNHAGLLVNPNYSLYEDFNALTKGSICSIESRCSSQNLPCSPPSLNFSYPTPDKGTFANAINEEEVLDSVMELESITNHVVDPFELSTSNVSAESQKEKILNFLKETNYCLGHACSLKSSFRDMSVSFTHCSSSENFCPINYVSSNNVCKKSPRPKLQDRFVIELTKTKVPKKDQHPALKTSSQTKSVSCINPSPVPCNPLNSDAARKKLTSSLPNERFYKGLRKVFHDWCERKEKANIEIILAEDTNDKVSTKISSQLS